MVIRLSYFVLGLFGALASMAGAKDAPTPPPPPMAQPVNLSIYRGHTVDIPLQGRGHVPSQLKFFIRTTPRYGTLGEIRLVDEKNAVVTYTHDGKKGTGIDTFLFAVQAADTAVSAPAPVFITISEEPSLFQTTEAPDFGVVSVGQNLESSVTIQNKGGGTISGHLEVDPPWTIIGPPEYSLGAKQTQQIRLLFTPTEERQYNGRLNFSHNPAAAMMLEGHGVLPFELTPSGPIELISTEKNLDRAAVLKIRNRTGHPQTLEITAPPQVSSPARVTLATEEEAAIPLRTSPGFLGSLDGSLQLKSPQWESSIPLHVFAARADLQMDPPSGLNLGTTKIGHRYHSSFRLSNIGGLDAQLTLGLPPEISVPSSVESFLLKAGATQVIDLSFEPRTAGEWTDNIKIQTIGGTTLKLPVQASISRDIFIQAPTPARAAIIVEEAAPGPSPTPQASEAYNNTPAIQKIDSSPMTPNEVKLNWEKPGPHALTYLVEYREITPSSQAPTIRWVKWNEPKIHEENGRVFLSLENLPPAHLWYIRISSIDEMGKSSPPSPTIFIATRPNRNLALFWWIAGILGLGGAAYAGILVRQKLEAQNAEDASRINRLGKS